MQFANRVSAGRLLAHALLDYAHTNAVVYGIARGGVVLACEVAQLLQVTLSALVLEEIAMPCTPGQAMAVVGEDGVLAIDPQQYELAQSEWFFEELTHARKVIEKRKLLYGRHQFHTAYNKTAIIIDDGMATSLMMQAAMQQVLEMNPKELVIGLPLAKEQMLDQFTRNAIKVVCLLVPSEPWNDLREHYVELGDVRDEEVCTMLAAYGSSGKRNGFYDRDHLSSDLVTLL